MIRREITVIQVDDKEGYNKKRQHEELEGFFEPIPNKKYLKTTEEESGRAINTSKFFGEYEEKSAAQESGSGKNETSPKSIITSLEVDQNRFPNSSIETRTNNDGLPDVSSLQIVEEEVQKGKI